MKIGVLGGTFDPVHRAHIAVAETARDALGLDKILMVPAGQPMSRPEMPVASARDRVAMLRLALEGKRRFEVSTIEIDRPGPTYTVDSITQLRKSAPDAEIYFILGCDSLVQMPEWKEPARLISLCRIVAAPRPGCQPDMKKLEKQIPGISENVMFLKGPELDISASEIREKVKRGESLIGLVPEPVADYIRKNKLYNREEKHESPGHRRQPA